MFEISKSTAELSPNEKRALLAQLLQKKASQSKYDLTLSSSQQAMWFLYKLAPQSWAYNVLFAGRIRSHVDIPALRGAFEALIERHPSLRTTYQERDSEPVQQVHEYSQVHFEETDASAWSQDELNNCLVEQAHRPFDLERGPVLRVNLLTQSAIEHILLLTVHHIAVDFWSLTVLLDELRVLYSAQRTGVLAFLPPLELQYADYVRWQAEMLASAEGERLWAYWQKQLGDELPVLNLPTDRPRPLMQTFPGASHAFKLSEELTRQLKALAQAEEATLYMTLLAAFQVLLYRYTGQEDILVGSPTTGRSRREFSGIVGDFINPVVLRADLSGNPTFKTFLAQARHTVLDALKHQDYPFRLLVERLHPPQDPSRSPLFQVMLILRKLHRFEELSEFMVPSETEARMDFGGLELEPLPLAQQEGQVDLTLEMIETDGSLKGVFKYNPDLFDACTVYRMAGHFQTLVSGVVANPEQPISTLPLLNEAEKYQLLVEWNDTQSDYPKDACIHQLFEAQVERTPDAVAVVFKKERLTYRELNRRANQVAHYLQALGVGPEVKVGLCMERSLLMVVGLLAILKAGGAYLPLDPAYPQERLAFMLEDSQMSVLLTQKLLLCGLPEHDAEVVCLDSSWKSIAQSSQENPRSSATAEHLAYVIYTSGSTGRPKGVQIPHHAVVNFLHSMLKRPGLTNQDILLAVTSLSFDIAALELFLTLIVGAKLVVVTREVAMDGAQLLAALSDSGATALQATPATWQLLLAAGWQGAGRFKALCGGEFLSRELTNQLLERGASLWNLYGPTETTIWSATYFVESSAGSVPIGRPIANTQIYLLDSYLQPVPVGVPGELCVGGAGLARGYLNRPELTAQKFVPNPYPTGYSDEPGACLYKTGDLARYLPDGNIEYLGRIDHQVKLRGFRIELGEISAVLSQHPSVRETVLLAREDIPGDKRLVAYVVSDQSQVSTPGELRRFLKEQLPEYMVPSAFVLLDALPLTPNGKVDRRALPVPDQARPELERAFVAPQDTLELQLTQIWEKVLGIGSVGVRDNFFELGGHSLLAVRLFAQIKEFFGKDLPLATLFQAPTIEQLANILCSQGWDAPRELLVPLQPGGNKPPLFCIYGILLYHDLARHLGPQQAVYGVYIQDEVNLLLAGRLETELSTLTSVADQATLYLKKIRTLQPVGPYFLAGESFGGLVAFEMAQQLHAQGEKVALLALFDTQAPGDMKGLPWRERVCLHLGNLLQKGSTYALQKVGQRIDSSKDRLVSIISSIYRKFDQGSGRVLPSYLQEVAQHDLRQQIRVQAVRNYVPHPYPGKVILFRAMNQSQFDAYYTAPQLWGSLAAGGLEVHAVPGDHISILQKPHVQVLAAKLRACLEQAQTD